jgi:teichoic acid transport system permease protein
VAPSRKISTTTAECRDQRQWNDLPRGSKVTANASIDINVIFRVRNLSKSHDLGAALVLARVGSGAQDVSQLIPFLLRVWRYFCGVMYSIASLPAALPGWAKDVLSVNPAAVYISLTRYAIMASMRADAPGAKPYNAGQCAVFNAKKTPALQAYCHPGIVTSDLWLAGLGWAVVAIAVGVLYFWQAETRYGRG